MEKYIVGMDTRTCEVRIAADTEDNRDVLIVLASGLTYNDATNYRDETLARVQMINERTCETCEN